MSKHTPGPWHPVAYCNYWALQTEPYYDDKDDLLNEEHHDRAAYNAKLAASAPDLKNIAETCLDYLSRPFDDQTYGMTEALTTKIRAVLANL